MRLNETIPGCFSKAPDVGSPLRLFSQAELDLASGSKGELTEVRLRFQEVTDIKRYQATANRLWPRELWEW